MYKFEAKVKVVKKLSKNITVKEKIRDFVFPLLSNIYPNKGARSMRGYVII
jgi:hypothetical protein